MKDKDKESGKPKIPDAYKKLEPVEKGMVTDMRMDIALLGSFVGASARKALAERRESHSMRLELEHSDDKATVPMCMYVERGYMNRTLAAPLKRRHIIKINPEEIEGIVERLLYSQHALDDDPDFIRGRKQLVDIFKPEQNPEEPKWKNRYPKLRYEADWEEYQFKIFRDYIGHKIQQIYSLILQNSCKNNLDKIGKKRLKTLLAMHANRLDRCFVYQGLLMVDLEQIRFDIEALLWNAEGRF